LEQVLGGRRRVAEGQLEGAQHREGLGFIPQASRHGGGLEQLGQHRARLRLASLMGVHVGKVVQCVLTLSVLADLQ
jgi:hypothetical protein